MNEKATRKGRNYWTKERLQHVANQFDSRADFKRNKPNEYRYALKIGVMDQIFAKHPNEGLKWSKSQTDKYRTKSVIMKVAKKCQSKSEFKDRYRSAYTMAKKLNVYAEVTKHMNNQRPLKRFLYLLVNHDRKTTYVGLTYDIKSRMRSHEKTKKFRQKTKIKLLVQEPVTEAEAVALEKQFLNQIKTEYPDYKNLNEAPTGSLGGKKKIYTFEKCHELAKKCKFRVEFKKNHPSAASVSQRNGWIDELFAEHKNFGYANKPNNYWNYERCESYGRKYQSRSAFKLGDKDAYNAASRKGFLDRIFKDHPTLGYKTVPNGYWTKKENCRKAAKNSKNIEDFREKYSGAYSSANSMGWIDDIFKGHPSGGRKRLKRGTFTFEKCRRIADGCKSYMEFYQNHDSAYAAARRNGWIEKLFPGRNSKTK